MAPGAAPAGIGGDRWPSGLRLSTEPDAVGSRPSAYGIASIDSGTISPPELPDAHFAPFDRLTPLMETLARINPVSHVLDGLRSLVIEGWNGKKIGHCPLSSSGSPRC